MTRQTTISSTTVLTCGAIILAISLGIRHGFGLFLQPMSFDNGWGREVFSLAIAIQNLIWGIAQPFTGSIADRFGAGRAIMVGAVLYVAGLLLMAVSNTPGMLTLSAGFLIGFGLSGTTFSIVFGAVSRALPPEKRSLGMGIAGAVGSAGQFIMLPGSMALISGFGWAVALVAIGGIAALMVPLATALRERHAVARQPTDISVRAALAEAYRHPGFRLLSFGYFVCGFQVVFIGLHLPAYLVDRGMSPETGMIVLALIGLFNIVGSLLAGYLGGRFPKPAILAVLYALRGVVIATFAFLVPVTAASAYVFGIVMGFLWLATVPLTNGVVATVFGVRNMAMIGGVAFVFHQVGAFIGGWLGGYLFDRTGSYDAVWAICIGLSVIATLLNVPIKERPVARLREAGST
jgi:MFS family permease